MSTTTKTNRPAIAPNPTAYLIQSLLSSGESATVAFAATPVRTPAAADVGVVLCDFLAELRDDLSDLDFALLLDDFSGFSGFSGVSRGVSSDVSHASGSAEALDLV